MNYQYINLRNSATAIGFAKSLFSPYIVWYYILICVTKVYIWGHNTYWEKIQQFLYALRYSEKQSVITFLYDIIWRMISLWITIADVMIRRIVVVTHPYAVKTSLSFILHFTLRLARVLHFYVFIPIISNTVYSIRIS